MGALKPWHIIVLVVVLILLFGAKRLPDAARSLGRSLRIIKAETKGLVDDDKDLAEKADAQHARQPLLAADRSSRRRRSRRRWSTRSSAPATPSDARPRPRSPWRFSLRRRGPSNFERAADGSMTLIEHIRELRNRLFWASLGDRRRPGRRLLLSQPVFDILKRPYCDV